MVPINNAISLRRVVFSTELAESALLVSFSGHANRAILVIA